MDHSLLTAHDSFVADSGLWHKSIPTSRADLVKLRIRGHTTPLSDEAHKPKGRSPRLLGQRAWRLVVVKVGTTSVTNSEGVLDEIQMRSIVLQVSNAVSGGYKVILVTSGAVAAGWSELGSFPRRNGIVFQQAAAATGQGVLMSAYRKYFRHYRLKVAQILLTANDLSSRISYMHTRNVLEVLLDLGVVPIVNENDVTSVEELKPLNEGSTASFSDNDILSVLVANAIRADILVVLTDVDGLYYPSLNSPRARLIETVDKMRSTPKVNLNDGNRFGRGGIRSKLRAAAIATSSGIPLVIANSRKKNVLLDILAGKNVGTFFRPGPQMGGTKRWIAFGASVQGRLHVNEHARKSILEGSGLFQQGLVKVTGNFGIGDVVSMVGPDYQEFARGSPNFSSKELYAITQIKVKDRARETRRSEQKEVIGKLNIYVTKDRT